MAVQLQVGSYTVNRFTEYRIDIDLDTDTDAFDMVFSNPNGVYSGFFNRFDKAVVTIDGIGVMNGVVDTVNHYISDSGSGIRISGRDIMSKLVDSDAMPGTKSMIVPGVYAKERCGAFGIKCVSKSTAPAVAKIIIGTGESEISVITNILSNYRERMWLIYDTAYVGKWATDDKPSYVFSRGKGGIPIKSLSLNESAANTKSEVRLYGAMSGGVQKIVGVAKNDALIAKGINRIQTKTSANNDIASRLTSSAMKDIQDSLREDITLEVTIHGSDTVILPNKVASVVDGITGITGNWFIKGVRYQFGLRSGHETVVTMIPNDDTFGIVWSGSSSSVSSNGKSNMSFDELISSIKGSKPSVYTGG